jgi:hypothetical protein
MSAEAVESVHRQLSAKIGHLLPELSKDWAELSEESKLSRSSSLAEGAKRIRDVLSALESMEKSLRGR